MLVLAGRRYKDVSLYLQKLYWQAANRGCLTVPSKVVFVARQYKNVSLYFMELYWQAVNIGISLYKALSGINELPILQLSNVLSIVSAGHRHTNRLAFHCHCKSVCHLPTKFYYDPTLQLQCTHYLYKCCQWK